MQLRASRLAGRPAPSSARPQLPVPGGRSGELSRLRIGHQRSPCAGCRGSSKHALPQRASVHRRPLLSQPAGREERHLGKADMLRGGVTRDGPFLDQRGRRLTQSKALALQLPAA